MQHPDDIKANQVTGDEIVSGGGEAEAAAFEVPDACERLAREELLSAVLDLLGERALKSGAELLPAFVVQEEGEALWGGIPLKGIAQGREICLEAVEAYSFRCECGMIAMTRGKVITTGTK